jgi:hypothetical protein
MRTSSFFFASALASAVVADSANSFSNPNYPLSGGILVWQLGTTQTISWTTTLQTYGIQLWQQSLTAQNAHVASTLIGGWNRLVKYREKANRVKDSMETGPARNPSNGLSSFTTSTSSIRTSSFSGLITLATPTVQTASHPLSLTSQIHQLRPPHPLL